MQQSQEPQLENIQERHNVAGHAVFDHDDVGLTSTLEAADLADSAASKEDTSELPVIPGVLIYGKMETVTPQAKLEKELASMEAQYPSRNEFRQAVADRCVHDLDFLSLFMFPSVSKASWPPLMKAVWSLLVDALMTLQGFRGEGKFALGIPRGFGKTTYMKLFILLSITFTRHTFIVIVGSVDNNAENIIKDVITALDSSHYRRIFGDYDLRMDINRQDEKIFYLNGKQIVLKAKGAVTSLRGINVDNRRPDFILMDDMQNEENAKSTTESDNLLTWMSSTLMPTRSPDGAMYLYIGNTYAHAGSILQKLIEDPDWVSLTLGAILSNGQSLWPEVHSLRSLLAGYRTAKSNGKEAEWLAQMMNATDISRQNLVNLVQAQNAYQAIIQDYSESHNAPADYKYIMIDPATSKENADDVAIGCGGSILGYNVLFGVDSRQRTPMATIQDALKMAIQYNTHVIFIEDVAYQDTLRWWCDYFFELWGIKYIEVRPISPGRTGKNVRILRSFQEINKYELLLHPDAYIPWKNQVRVYDKLKTNNKDDVLDLAHYVPLINRKHAAFLSTMQEKAILHQMTQARNTALAAEVRAYGQRQPF